MSESLYCQYYRCHICGKNIPLGTYHLCESIPYQQVYTKSYDDEILERLDKIIELLQKLATSAP